MAMFSCLSLALSFLLCFCNADASPSTNFLSTYFQPNQQQQDMPVTDKRVAFNQRFRKKFDEIFRAYSEGYKAAMIAMQSRSMIPRVPESQSSTMRIPKTVIPKLPVMDKTKPAMMSRPNPAAVINQIRSKISNRQPLMRELTENAIEKSGIPRPVLRALIARRKAQVLAKRNEVMSAPDSYVPRFNPLVQFLKQQTGRDRLTQARYQIPHMNIDPSWYEEPRIARQTAEIVKETSSNAVQNAMKKNMALKAKRAAAAPILVHKRGKRSRTPYLGQNLDALGIVRVIPHLDDKPKIPARRMEIPRPKPEPVPQQDTKVTKRVEIPTADQDQDSVFQPLMSQRTAIPRPFMSPPQIAVPIIAMPKVETEEEKREKIAQLNYAARHRNVYSDSVGGDPYGSASGLIGSRLGYAKHRRRRHIH